MDTALKEESRGCFTVSIAGKTGEGKTPLQDHQQHLLTERNLGLDQGRGVLGSCGNSVLSTYEGRWPGALHPSDCQSEYSKAKWH